MMLRTRQDGRAAIVSVTASRIDAAVAIEFKDQMRVAIDETSGRVVLDLSQVDFVDSSGLGAIVAAMKLMPTGRKLELAALTPDVDRVFRMTRMDSIFTIHPDTQTAFPVA